MSTIDLTKYGITDVKEIVHNPSYEVLFAEETNSALEGYEKGQLTELDTVNVMTGIYTGRSPKDKFFVKNEASENTVWWTSEEYKNDNKPCSEEAWNDLRAKAVKQLSGKKLYVVDTFCGTNEATRLKVRFIMEALTTHNHHLGCRSHIDDKRGTAVKIVRRHAGADDVSANRCRVVTLYFNSRFDTRAHKQGFYAVNQQHSLLHYGVKRRNDRGNNSSVYLAFINSRN